MRKKLNIAVLMGGKSSEYEISLDTGQNVLEYLDSKKYRVTSIIITKKGDWLVGGRKKPIYQALRHIDVVFNAMHGEFGEDGKIQGLLECHGVPYTGSGVLASALGMDKPRSYELFKSCGLTTPRNIIIDKKYFYRGANADNYAELMRKLSKKLVVKPSCLGSSVGISIVSNKKDLKKAINKAMEKCNEVIIEEFIEGLEVTCGIIENIKKKKYFALPLTEITPPDGRFFDYEVKYDGSTQEITPARINKNLTSTIQEQAIQAHQSLGCRGYSRVDFILKNNKIPYILEVNTLPGLTSESLLPKAAKSAGIEFSKLLDIIIANAINN